MRARTACVIIHVPAHNSSPLPASRFLRLRATVATREYFIESTVGFRRAPSAIHVAFTAINVSPVGVFYPSARIRRIGVRAVICV